MASILKVDTITGVATAGSIAITGEGNSTTTNLQQGLCKAYAHFTGGFSVADSFNVASLTDNGTGRPEFNFTNNMGNSTYSGAGHSYNRAVGANATDGNFTSSSAAMSLFSTGGSFDDVGGSQIAGVNYFGDLA